MAATRAPAIQSTGRLTRKSPLRIATMPEFGAIPSPGPVGSARQQGADSGAQEITAADLRQMMIREFADWLRCQTNRHKRPFQEDTISDYAETARTLSRWMTGQEIDGDFTACDAAMLNRFFADYRKAHTQGGTNTRQRNLHPYHRA